MMMRWKTVYSGNQRFGASSDNGIFEIYPEVDLWVVRSPLAPGVVLSRHRCLYQGKHYCERAWISVVSELIREWPMHPTPWVKTEILSSKFAKIFGMSAA